MKKSTNPAADIESAARTLLNLLQLNEKNYEAEKSLSDVAIASLNDVHQTNARLLARQGGAAMDQINIAGERARQVRWALGDIFDCAKSLTTASKYFPDHCGVNTGEIDPKMAIESFCGMLEKRANVLLDLVNNEDHLNEEGL
jgi:hypothetical protein